MAVEKLLTHFNDLPAGACWVTGRALQDFRDAVIEDRAILAETSGNTEPTEGGRVFTITPGESNTIDLDVSVMGIIHTATFVGTVV